MPSERSLDGWRVQALEITLGEQTEGECFHRVPRMNTRKRTISRQVGALDLANRADNGTSDECCMNPLDTRSSNDSTVVMSHVVVNPPPPTGWVCFALLRPVFPLVPKRTQPATLASTRHPSCDA
jgi:hypothetical protein